jgi:hypothetical protein
VYDGSQFITLLSNVGNTNIYVSPTGNANWTLISQNFGNESGYLAANSLIVLAVTPTYHKYSLNSGYSWLDIEEFPAGIPSRPHYDGSVWWIGINGGTGTSNTYVSPTGSNNWSTSSITGIFPTGYPTGFISFNVSSNLNCDKSFHIISSSTINTFFQLYFIAISRIFI